MKIENFLIRDYGPLENREKNSLSDFNLIFGKNESGKTLIIDALIKIFLGQNGSYFDKINRVDEKPEGYVNLVDNNNQKIKLKGQILLSNLLDLTGAEFCNIFVIRDSDLSMHKEEDFYNNITDRLLGLRINDIKKLHSELLDIGKLTPSGNFRNIKEEKLDDRIKNARNCKNEINILISKIRDEKLDDLEGINVKTGEKVEELKVEIEYYEKARKREKYEQGVDNLNKLIEKKDKFDRLTIFNDNDIQLWRKYENETKIYNENKAKLKISISQNQDQLKVLLKDTKEKDAELKIPEKIKRTIDEGIKPEIKSYEMDKGKLASKAVVNKFLTSLWMVSSLLFCIFLVFGLANSLFVANFLAILFAFLTVGTLIIFIYPYIIKKSHCAGVIERINLSLKKVGLKCEDYEDISSQIFNFEKNYEIKKEELNRLVFQKEKLEDEINNNLNNAIPEIEMKIKVKENLINSLKVNSKVETINDYEENLALKKKFETDMDHQKIKLNTFGIKGGTVEENIVFWDNEIKKLEEYKNEAIDRNYSEEVVMKLKEVLLKLENQLNQDQSKYSELKENLLEIERNANSILQSTDNSTYCRATSDLFNVEKRLEKFISKNKRKKEDVLEIIKIFNEIEIKEKEKISNLLSRKSSVFEYFKEITDGLYEEVNFNMDTGEIKAKRKDNEIIGLNSLSGGAYDQLYFSIRLALAEKVLNGNTGFLILDDPFIKSDPERLRRQIDLLKRISRLGWQIIYFSCKDEILSNLKPEINNQNINLIELPNLFS